MHRSLVAAALVAVFTPACSCTDQTSGRARLSLDEAARTCAVLQACFPADWRSGLFGSDLSSCSTGIGTFLPTSPGALVGPQAYTTGLEGPLLDVYHCLLGAGGDCTKAAACWARTGQPGACSPAASLEQGTCTGNVLSGCSADGYSFAIDCGAYGGACHEDSVFFARVAVCDKGPCPSHTSCRGSQAESCMGGGLFLGDCASVGLDCRDDPDGGATCVSSATCDGGASTCEGSVAVQCGLDGTPYRADCAHNAMLTRCQEGACIETGNECTVSGSRASCDGALVKFCQDGFQRQLDCAALGFASCRNGACSVCAADAGSCGCVKTSCASAGKNCGTISDGCGGTLDCGTCTAPKTCGGGGLPNVCSTPCTPTTCAALGKTCGTVFDGCAGTLSCGTCAAPTTCGGGGTPNVCGTGCTPTTCAALGKSCGSASDGCGGTLSCGTCSAPQTCGGGGTPGVCGACTPTTCTTQGWQCGTAPDGCGGTLSCTGACGGNRVCGGGGQNLCGRSSCAPTTCAAQGKTCGTISDGCASALSCGTCGAGQSCVANRCQ